MARSILKIFPEKVIDEDRQILKVWKNPCKGIILTSENQKKHVFYDFSVR